MSPGYARWGTGMLNATRGTNAWVAARRSPRLQSREPPATRRRNALDPADTDPAIELQDGTNHRDGSRSPFGEHDDEGGSDDEARGRGNRGRDYLRLPGGENEQGRKNSEDHDEPTGPLISSAGRVFASSSSVKYGSRSDSRK